MGRTPLRILSADVDIQLLLRVTPLMFACMNNHSHAAHELLAAGADITR